MKVYWGYSLVFGKRRLGVYTSIEDARKYWPGWDYIWEAGGTLYSTIIRSMELPCQS